MLLSLKPNWDHFNWAKPDTSLLRDNMFNSYADIAKRAPADYTYITDDNYRDLVVLAKFLAGDHKLSAKEFETLMAGSGFSKANVLADLFVIHKNALECFLLTCDSPEFLREVLFHNRQIRWHVREIWEEARSKVARKKADPKAKVELTTTEQLIWQHFENGVITEEILRHHNEWQVDNETLLSALNNAYLGSTSRDNLESSLKNYRHWVQSFRWYHLHSITWAWIKWVLSVGDCYDVNFMVNLGKQINTFRYQFTTQELEAQRRMFDQAQSQKSSLDAESNVETVAELKKSLEDMQRQVRSLRTTVSKLRDELNVVRRDQSYQAAHTPLRVREKFRKQEERFSDLLLRVKAHDAELNEMGDVLGELNTQVESHKDTLRLVADANTVERLETTLSQLSQTVQVLSANYDELSSQSVVLMQQDLAALKEEITQLTKAQAQFAGVNAVDALKETCEALSRTADEIKADQAKFACSDSVAEQARKIQALSTRVIAIETKPSDMPQIRDELARVAREVAQLKASQAEAAHQTQLEELGTRITHLTDRLESVQQLPKQLQSLRDLHDELAEQVEHIANAQVEREALVTVERMSGSIGELQTQLDSLRLERGEVSTLQRRLQQLIDRVSEVEANLNHFADLESDITDTLAHKADTKEISALVSELDQIKLDMKDAVKRASFSSLERQVQLLVGASKSWATADAVVKLNEALNAQAKRLAAVADSAAQQQALEGVQTNLADLQERLAQVEANNPLAIEALQRQSQRLAESLAALEETHEALVDHATVVTMQEKIRELTTTLAQVEQAQQTAATVAVTDDLQARIISLQDQLRDLKRSPEQIRELTSQFERLSLEVQSILSGQTDFASQADIAELRGELEDLKLSMRDVVRQEAYEQLHEQVKALLIEGKSWAKAETVTKLFEECARVGMVAELHDTIQALQTKFLRLERDVPLDIAQLREQVETISQALTELNDARPAWVKQEQLTAMQQRMSALSDQLAKVEAAHSAFATVEFAEKLQDRIATMQDNLELVLHSPAQIRDLDSRLEAVSQQLIAAIKEQESLAKQKEVAKLFDELEAMKVEMRDLAKQAVVDRLEADLEALTAEREQWAKRADMQALTEKLADATAELDKIRADQPRQQKVLAERIDALSEAFQQLNDEQSDTNAGITALQQALDQAKAKLASGEIATADAASKLAALSEKLSTVEREQTAAHRDAVKELTEAHSALVTQVECLQRDQSQLAHADAVTALQKQFAAVQLQLTTLQDDVPASREALQEQLGKLAESLAELSTAQQDFVPQAQLSVLRESVAGLNAKMIEVENAQQHFVTVDMFTALDKTVASLTSRVDQIEMGIAEHNQALARQHQDISAQILQLVEANQTTATAADLQAVKLAVEGFSTKVSVVLGLQDDVAAHAKSIAELSSAVDAVDEAVANLNQTDTALQEGLAELKQNVTSLQGAQAELVHTSKFTQLEKTFGEALQKLTEREDQTQRDILSLQEHLAEQLAALELTIRQSSPADASELQHALDDIRQQFSEFTRSDKYQTVLDVHVQFGEKLEQFTTELNELLVAYGEDSDLRKNLHELYDRLKVYDPREPSRRLDIAKGKVNQSLASLSQRFERDETEFLRLQKNVRLIFTAMNGFFTQRLGGYAAYWQEVEATLKEAQQASPEANRRPKAAPGTPEREQTHTHRARPSTPQQNYAPNSPSPLKRAAPQTPPQHGGVKARPTTPTHVKAKPGTPEVINSHVRANPSTPTQRAMPTTPTRKAAPTTPPQRRTASAKPATPQKKTATAKPSTPQRRDSFIAADGKLKHGAMYQPSVTSPLVDVGKENRSSQQSSPFKGLV